ncbi:uncharacterized protein [Maniola hyperantus]|uniref:uncharacterized protein isoform X1 n=2 Tax=Aphantopus hyperantus TaxID=2795564 RepID=UPI0015691C4D|nr:uncharacterized protein LOC117994748 [Maniola hyperantus]
MSSTGRGRGYTGRHQLPQRAPRPGDLELDEKTPARIVAEHSPRVTDLSNVEPIKPDMEEPVNDDKPVKETVEKRCDDEALLEVLHVDEQFAPLLVLLEQFSPGEDGIQFNRKLRHFETTVTTMCPDEARLQQAFATFRAAALQSSVTSRKLAAVGASFTRQQRQQLLRAALLNVVMQGTFTKLDILERSNPIYLINAANLMGDYFAEARLCNGNKVHILANPLLQYMRALLASDDLRAHRSLATQLMQNGRELLSVLAQDLDELSISIRLRLLTPPPVSIIWLLLSADLCLNKFLPLPNTLQQFYAAHLDLTIDESFSEVTYGSWKKKDTDYRSDNSSDTDKASQNLSQISLGNDDDTKPKLRPILGAGAGLLRQEQMTQETFDTWTKSNLTKRYDLNSWRQSDEKKEESEPVFNPTVLPPNLQSYVVPDYPPPNFNNFQENYANYLQQGDGTYIQNFQSQPNYNAPEFVPQFTATTEPNITQPERVNNEIQQTANIKKPIENWRKEKSDLTPKEDSNKKKNWTRQRSKDNVNDEEKEEKFRSVSRSSRDSRPSQGRLNRRNSGEGRSKTPPKRHVMDVPRNHKYWDHDDRCDKDYNS